MIAKVFRVIFLFISCFVINGIPAKAQHLTKDSIPGIAQALAAGRISVDIVSRGGHSGDCIYFNVDNLSADTQFFRIEPGRRLESVDSSMQDILIVREERIALAPYEKRKIRGYGFCCQSHMHSPTANSVFSIGRMAPEPWIRLAEAINMGDFPKESIQHAIWVLSDNHPFASLHADDPDAVWTLRNTLAAILGIELPWYTITYTKADDQLFSGQPEYLYGSFSYYIPNNCQVTMVVRDANGEVVRVLMNSNPHGPGDYDHDMGIFVGNLSHGVYTIWVHENNANLIRKLSFTL